MSDSQALTEVQKILKNERAFLPVAALLAVAMAGLVIWYRLDQGPKAFLAGLLTGSLGAIAVAVYVYVVRLGTALRGEQPSGLLKDARRLASSKLFTIPHRTSLWPLKSSRRTSTVDLETFFIFQPIFGFFVSGSSGGGSGL